MPFSFKTFCVKINVRFFNLIYPLSPFVISLQKGVFKGARNILWHRLQDKGGKAMKP